MSVTDPRIVHRGGGQVTMHHESTDPKSGKPKNTASGWMEHDSSTHDGIKQARGADAMAQFKRSLTQ
jgi:hypothetical protein